MYLYFLRRLIGTFRALTRTVRQLWKVVRYRDCIVLRAEHWDRLLLAFYPSVSGTGFNPGAINTNCSYCGAIWTPNRDGLYEGQHFSHCTAGLIEENLSARVSERHTVLLPVRAHSGDTNR